jgi:hypothetical protein
MFQKLDLFLPSSEWGRDLLCWFPIESTKQRVQLLLGPALCKEPNVTGVYAPYLRLEKESASKTLCSVYF